MLEFEVNKLVSSANSIKLIFKDALQRSLTYIKNKIRPSIDA